MLMLVAMVGAVGAEDGTKPLIGDFYRGSFTPGASLAQEAAAAPVLRPIRIGQTAETSIQR
jgi:hypothetical protein